MGGTVIITTTVLMSMMVMVLSETANNPPSVFINCPSPMTFNTSSTSIRIWWTVPSVVPNKVLSVWKATGPIPGSYFPAGQHTVVYKAHGIDDSISTCKLVFTVFVIRCEPVNLQSQLLSICSDGNSINSQCSLQCISGYKLTGSSNVYCKTNGEWSSAFPTCARKSCRSLQRPTDGYITCTTPQYQHGSRCYFGCYTGYQLSGHSVRVCRGRKWSGSLSTCVDVNECEASDEAVRCLEHQMCINLPGHYQCRSMCSLGARYTNNRCIDNQPPTFIYCPERIYANTLGGARSAIVYYTTPIARDNSQSSDINVTRIYGNTAGALFPAGYNLISYRATDSSGNNAICRFYIVVKARICRSLVTPRNGFMDCFQPSSRERWCEFGCNRGYDLMGSWRRNCTGTTWTGTRAICNEAELLPFSFVYCPQTKRMYTDIGSESAIVYYDIPRVNNDIFEDVNITLESGQLPGSSILSGVHAMHFRATNEYGQVADCKFYIVVTESLTRSQTFRSSGRDEDDPQVNIQTDNEGSYDSLVNDDDFYVDDFHLSQQIAQSPARNDGWSEWAAWESCTVTCGGSLHKRTRTCIRPAENCTGQRDEWQQCNVHDCSLEFFIRIRRNEDASEIHIEDPREENSDTNYSDLKWSAWYDHSATVVCMLLMVAGGLLFAGYTSFSVFYNKKFNLDESIAMTSSDL